jgi:1-acyl-sn-glycerol-3-phosphate acyltransferase
MLRGVWVALVLVVATIATGVPAILLRPFSPTGDVVLRAAKLWAHALLRATGARIECSGLDANRPRTPRVYIANHQSFVDVWALLYLLGTEARFVAKDELRRVPVLGWAMSAGGFVFVDRANRARAVASLRAAAATIRGGRSVVLFAEGTRSRDGGLQPFKRGPFHLALEAEVPIVPVAIRGSWRILPPDSLRVRPGPVRVEFLEPIDPKLFRPGDVAGLLARVESVLRARVESNESEAEA